MSYNKNDKMFPEVFSQDIIDAMPFPTLIMQNKKFLSSKSADGFPETLIHALSDSAAEENSESMHGGCRGIICIKDNEGGFQYFNLSPVTLHNSSPHTISAAAITDMLITRSGASAIHPDNNTIIKELQHRVKNSFITLSSLLALQEYNADSQSAKEALRESRDRAHAIMRLYEQLSVSESSSSAVRLDSYLNRLTSDIHMTSSINTGSTNLSMQLEPVYICAQSAMPLGLIINEILSNAYKHAFTGKKDECRITVTSGMINPQQAHITITDNGKGLPEDFNLEKAETLGMTIIQQLTRQIGGTLSCGECDGTSVRIVFPAILE